MSIWKKTKIIATLGPAVTGDLFSIADLTDENKEAAILFAKETISKMYDKGVNAVRFNFSHGTHEEHYVRLKLAQEVALNKKINICTILDTKGPEIRVYQIENGQCQITKGDVVIIYTLKKKLGNSSSFSVFDYSNKYNMAKDVKVGSFIYVDDGKLNLKVEEVNVDAGLIRTAALNSWVLKTNKRINLPHTDYSIPFLSEKDKNDIMFAIKHNFNYIAASFVNSAENVHQIRALLKANHAEHIKIIAKVESHHAVKEIDHIIAAADGIMVARGDLGLELQYYEIPNIQKYIIKKCRYEGKFVIVATQMLDSLETKMYPTRAEVTDVFYAVERGTDATMLSGETATGINPVNTTKVMRNIIRSSESFFDYERAILHYFKKSIYYKTDIGKLIIKIAYIVAPVRNIKNDDYQFSMICVFSNDTKVVEALSNIRTAAPIFLVTERKELANAFGLNYGVYVRIVKNLDDAIKNCKTIIDNINEEFDEVLNTLIVINNKIIFVEN